MGQRCPVIGTHKAMLVNQRETKKFYEQLGNPAVFNVEEPDAASKVALKTWLRESRDIPVTAKHIVVKNCYYCAKRTESFTMNPVEVLLLVDGGGELEDHCPSYFPAYKVSAWIKQHCSSNGRKWHVISSVAPANEATARGLYDYSS